MCEPGCCQGGLLDNFIDGAKMALEDGGRGAPTLWWELMVSMGVLGIRVPGFLGECLRPRAAYNPSAASGCASVGTGPAGFQLGGHQSGAGHF